MPPLARLGIVLLVTLVLLLAAPMTFHAVLDELNPALQGQRLAEQTGCFACHGAAGGGGVSNPGGRNDEVPALGGGTVMMYAHNEQEVFEYIKYGMARRHQADADYMERVKKALLQMPAYGPRLRDAQIESLVSYVMARNGYPVPPTTLAAGRQVVESQGCLGCHNASGIGGVSNPGSFKGYIAGWRGRDFDDLVHGDEELREWVENGEVARLQHNSVAAWFLDRSAIHMPAFKSRLKAAEIASVVAYVKWLHGRPAGWRQGDPLTDFSKQ
ncbi:MAG: c-type cytochrome [Candidatus Xenobia bacterium]